MDLKPKAIFLLALATANAGLILLTPKILEGPSSKTTLVGPDGSIISAFAPGGKILLDHGPLLQGAPEVVATAGVAQPLPVADTHVVEEVPSVVTESKVDVETVSVDAGAEAVVAKAAPAPEKLVQSDAAEAEAEAATTAEVESLEETTTVAAAKNETDTPADVVPLSKDHALAGVKTVASPVVLSFTHDSPFFAPEYSAFEGHFVPDEFEHGFDDSFHPALFDW